MLICVVACTSTVKRPLTQSCSFREICTTLAYYIDQAKTKELLQYILHDYPKVKVVQDKPDQMTIIAKSNFSVEHKIMFFFDNYNQSLIICPTECNSWSNYGRQFAKKLQNQYLNVAKTG